ncbi:MAG: nucleotidyltransferase substrate binding protein [Methylococcales bacterium]|nr:nucleotidyltransferase substrate binding protein [Methylococcales bacterium]
MTQDIRWIQRFNNFLKAFAQLTKFMARDSLNELEEQGLIQSFEYNHELAWKTQKDFLEYRGVINLYGSKDVTREAFKVGLITESELWMEMIKDRNLSSHTYHEETTQKIINHIIDDYYSEFAALIETLKKHRDESF